MINTGIYYNDIMRLFVLKMALMCTDQSADSDLVLKKALCLLQRKFDIHHLTVQVERYCAATMKDCLQCQVPKD